MLSRDGVSCIRSGCYRGRVNVTVRDGTAAATAVAGPATAVIGVRWKPSAGSRPLSEISALSAPPAQIVAHSATTGLRPRARLALPVRQEIQSVATATEPSTSRLPIQRNRSWWTERARAGGAERSEERRLSGPYSRERGAVRVSEREYPAQRPPAVRGLSTLSCECGAVSGRCFFHTYSIRNT